MRLNALLGMVTAFGVVAISAPAVSAQAQENVQAEPVAVYVKVEPGDSLSKVATRHDTTYRRIFDANEQIKHPDLIYPGDTLRIPAADEQLAQRELPVAAQAAEVSVAKPVVKRTEQKPAAAPAQRRAVEPAPQPVGSISSNVWDRLAQCESGGNWSINTGNGYYGGLQFSLSSWRAVGGSGYPHQASKSEQIARGEMLQARQGWGAWPACTAKLGIR